MENKAEGRDPELDAMGTVYGALSALDREAQARVLDYVIRRLSLSNTNIAGLRAEHRTEAHQSTPNNRDEESAVERAKTEVEDNESEAGPELEGVSPVARKWMRRNGLSEAQLSSLFSLGVDEIDLVAKSVPGNSAKQKFENVVLLEGVASYLGTGVARIEQKKLKQAAGHYGADPGTNFSHYMKGIAAEVTGSAANGFTLTARGLNSATELVKEMSAPNK